MTTLLLQLSDPHIREPDRLAYSRIETADYLRRAIATIAKLPQQPDAVVITGDLTGFGRAAEYDHLRELLVPLAMPVYLMPGNHDDRNQLRKSFSEHGYLGSSGFVQYSVAIGSGAGQLQLIALDTVVPGASEGCLCAERLNWLSSQLDAWPASCDCTASPAVSNVDRLHGRHRPADRRGGTGNSGGPASKCGARAKRPHTSLHPGALWRHARGYRVLASASGLP